jgi:hypothetical protein
VSTDFRTWRQEHLAVFALEANQKVTQQEQEIKELQEQLKAVHLAWRNALRELAANATVKP